MAQISNRLTQEVMMKVANDISAKKASGEVNGSIAFRELEKMVQKYRPGHKLCYSQVVKFQAVCDVTVARTRKKRKAAVSPDVAAAVAILADVTTHLFIAGSYKMSPEIERELRAKIQSLEGLLAPKLEQVAAK